MTRTGERKKERKKEKKKERKKERKKKRKKERSLLLLVSVLRTEKSVQTRPVLDGYCVSPVTTFHFWATG